MPPKFLDTKFVYGNNRIKRNVHTNEIKPPVHWTSKIPKRCKLSATNDDLNRAARIPSAFT